MGEDGGSGDHFVNRYVFGLVFVFALARFAMS